MKLLSSHKGLSEKYHNILCCEEIAINLLSLFNMHKRMCESVRCNSVVLFELFLKQGEMLNTSKTNGV